MNTNIQKVQYIYLGLFKLALKKQTIVIFLSTHEATKLCLRRPRRVCRAGYNPDVGSTECDKFLTAGPTCLLGSIHQHTPDGTGLTSPDAALELRQSKSPGNY